MGDVSHWVEQRCRPLCCVSSDGARVVESVPGEDIGRACEFHRDLRLLTRTPFCHFSRLASSVGNSCVNHWSHAPAGVDLVPTAMSEARNHSGEAGEVRL